jgi:xanthine dehydrogenase YagT iron-sulfur-binding subunit
MQLHINGELRAIDVDFGDTLLDVLRERVGLSGTKRGCDMGACGACTVLVDGRRVKACLMLAAMTEGSAITTIEGIAPHEPLHPIQQAFVDHDGLQCGYCTPGQIMSAIAYMSEGHADVSNPAVIREWMSGNLCRCGAYANIVAAVAAVAAQLPRTPADAR